MRLSAFGGGVVAFAFLLASASEASPRPAVQRVSALPRNDFHRFDDVRRISNITEEQFHKIIDTIIDRWKPLAEIQGAKLEVVKKWADSTVNAYASQSGNVWTVEMFGGLARRPEVTPDGFALVVCHELGHHFGGYAFKGERWAAAEGESDYFATHVCGKEIFGSQPQANRRFRRGVPDTVKDQCDATWKTPAQQELCYRNARAGLSLASLLAALEGSPAPKFETPDPTKVTKTNTAHPRAQCRLDTYFQGGLCSKSYDLRVIPGKKHPSGQDSPEAEAEAAKQSCMRAGGFERGTRPSCWFKPYLN